MYCCMKNTFGYLKLDQTIQQRLLIKLNILKYRLNLLKKIILDLFKNTSIKYCVLFDSFKTKKKNKFS